MSVWSEAWQFTRDRLSQSWEDLDHRQMSWRPYARGHSIYELLHHIAGAEHYWWMRMSGIEHVSSDLENKLEQAVRAGFLREGQFPFSEDEMTHDGARQILAMTGERILPILQAPSDEQLKMEIESPMGPMIDGKGGLIRLVQHAAYHTGQIWSMRMDPDFPS